MLYIQEDKNGVIFKVWISFKAKKNQLSGLWADALHVKVAALPVEGKANETCCSFLAQELRISKSAVKIIKGTRSREKLIKITGVNQQQILDLLINKN
jgi:hypothetical protein